MKTWWVQLLVVAIGCSQALAGAPEQAPSVEACKQNLSHALANEAVQSFNRELCDIRSACDGFTLSQRRSDRSLRPEPLARIIDLIHALPKTEAHAKMVALLPSLLATAREVDAYTGGDSGWKKGRRIGESVLDFAAKLRRREQTTVELDPPSELMKTQLQVAATLIAKQADLEFVVASLLWLDPAPATSQLLAIFARHYAVGGKRVAEVADLWARSNQASAQYLLGPQGGSGSVSEGAKLTPFFYASQLALARFLVATGEPKWMARAVNIVRGFSDEIGPRPETYAGRLVTSPVFYKIEGLLSLAELLPTRKAAFVLDALDLAYEIPATNTKDIPDFHGARTLAHLVRLLADINESQASRAFRARWAQTLDGVQMRSESADAIEHP